MNIYITNIHIIPNDCKASYLETTINQGINYTLEEAVNFIKYTFNNEYYNKYEKDPENEKELTNFINSEKIYYTAIVKIVSGERKGFNSIEKLMEYFNENISKISNDKLFDFLLSLCDYYIIEYDYLGNIISEEPIFQCPITEEGCYYERVQFTRDSCSRGEYIFEVR